jgi:hypothetical protein
MRHDIFATPFWHIKCISQELVDELYQGAYRFKKKYPSNQKSNQGGYQTHPLEWKDFHPQGIEYIDKVVGDIFKFEVESWWYNINGKGHWNLPHTHPSSDMALVWYITDSDGLIHLMNPHPQRKILRSGDHISIDAKKGDIIMFPSDIIHYVLPNKREKDRISISMNLQLS